MLNYDGDLIGGGLHHKQALSLHYQLCFHSKFVRHLSARKKKACFMFMSWTAQFAGGILKVATI